MKATLARAVRQRARYVCEYCRLPEIHQPWPSEIDHIIARQHGGPTVLSNLALICLRCNLFKADHLTGADAATGLEVRLFHPRQDRWDDHFQLDAETGSLQGLTPVGRATVLRLQMNSPLQLEARRQWMCLGLFP